MGCTVREKHIRASRKNRPVKLESDRFTTTATMNCNGDSLTNPKPVIKTENYHMALNSLSQNLSTVSSPNPNSVFDDSGWGHCTEKQLEEIMLKKLECLYNEAINKLVALGYDEDVALKAILRNGHCYGGNDVLTNILQNSLAYLSSGCSGTNSEEPESAFTDLRQLEEYSHAEMVCMLQQVKPYLSNGDAMWCLLMNDLNVGRASVMEIPLLPSPSGNGNGCDSGLVSSSGSVEDGVSNGETGVVAPTLRQFHGDWGFGNNGMAEFPMNGEMTPWREIECPKRFNLSPSMERLLKRNVAMFAAGFRANSKQFQSQVQPCSSSLSGEDSSSDFGAGFQVKAMHSEESQFANKEDVVNSVTSKFRDLNVNENKENVSLDQKDEMILSLINQINELEKQVKERKDWAHQKAMQAARKLSHDFTELKMLRMEREETQWLEKGKQTLDDSTMKRLSEMENALRKASGQVDCANAAVRKLETENAEIRAEVEASKLSASESVIAGLEVAKREKKCLKRLLAWEKQKRKFQEDIAEKKKKISELQQEFAQADDNTKEAETKWRQEHKTKELAFAQLEEERHLNEAAEASNKRKLEALRLKIEIDFHRHKDDLQRLEQEFARLKESAQSTEVENPSTHLLTANSVGVKPEGETIVRLLHELDLEDYSPEAVCHDRECMICMKDEVSIVFLPCAHQVICANCNENYGRKSYMSLLSGSS